MCTITVDTIGGHSAKCAELKFYKFILIYNLCIFNVETCI